MMISSFICFLANDITYFFFVAKRNPIVYICYIFLLWCSVDGNLGGFPNSAVVNSTVMSIDVQVTL